MTTVTKHWRNSAGSAEMSLLKSPSSISPAFNLKRLQTVLAFHNQSVIFSLKKVIASFAAAKEMNVSLQFYPN